MFSNPHLPFTTTTTRKQRGSGGERGENASSDMDRAAASSLQSRGKMALRAPPGSLEVSSRRDWDVSSCVGIFLAGRSRVYMPQLTTSWCSQKLNPRKTKIPGKSINQLGWLGTAVRICILKWNVQCFLLPSANINAPWSMLAWGGRKVSCTCVHTHIFSIEIFSTGGSSFFFNKISPWKSPMFSWQS